ncbi:MAG: hypothetical protein AAF368_06915 [Planctomycetota bacterium]
MTRRELAYVLLRLSALTSLLQALTVLPYFIDILVEDGVMRTMAFRHLLAGLLRFGVFVALWVFSPKLAQLVAND